MTEASEVTDDIETVPAGIDADTVASPEYWVHVASQLRVRDVIEVIAEDNAYEIILRVVSATRGALKFRVLAEWASDAEPVELTRENDDGGLVVNWGGPAHKHRIVDTATGEPVSHGYATRVEAEAARATLLNERRSA